MKISVVMPAYNEAKTIENAVRAFAHQDAVCEVIVVDGLSEDGTFELVQALSKDLPKAKVIREAKRQGKGNAVALGAAAAVGDVIVVQDADNEIPAEDVVRVASEVSDSTPVVFGSRFLDPTQECAYPSMTYANKFFTQLFNVRHRTSLTDVLTGCKAARASLWKAANLSAKGYEIEIELAEKFHRAAGIVERPVVFRPRKNEDGKKIRLKHAFIILRRVFIA